MDRVRVDKWLWAARFAKTRSAATELVLAGHVKVSGERVKPAREVALGDTIEIRLGTVRRVVVVTGLADRRGPAKVAATLYEETPESREERERLALDRRLARPLGADLGARPTKLRAVNLGARNKVPMARLRTLLEDAGYGNVRTYVASGNVLLDGPSKRKALASELERLVADAFGVTTTVILRKPRELAATVEAHPFGDPSETHVAFLAARPTKAAAARLEDPDAVLAGAELYLRLPRGVHGSRLSNARIESLLGVPSTLRNWRTVVALAELTAEA